MKFPWYKYVELPTDRVNTLQVFITKRCQNTCPGCFARHVMKGEEIDITMEEYHMAICDLIDKGGVKVNLLGGEPTLHPLIGRFIALNRLRGLKTTLYTNGAFLGDLSDEKFEKIYSDVKIRLSLYCKSGGIKSYDSLTNLKGRKFPLEICFMVSKGTNYIELLQTAYAIERDLNCNVFFISSLRELDNPRQDFFDDTDLTMPVVEYKELVHKFLTEYEGSMEIHVSKRGVFESTVSSTGSKCRFANYFIGGKIIQCPYDVVNLKFQDDYSFDKRYCQHNNSCLMSKIIYRRTNRK